MMNLAGHDHRTQDRKSGVRKQRLCGTVLFHGAHFKDHYPVDSVFFVAGSGERAQSYIKQDRGLSSLH